MLITGSGFELEYGVDDVHRFTYNTNATGINGTHLQTDYFVKDGRIIFKGVTSAEDVALYTVGGIRIPVRIEIHDNCLILPLSGIISGIYLLNICGRTVKFLKK